jgi:putative transposase
MENCLETFLQENQEPREIKRALSVKMCLLGYKHREIMPILGVSSGFISKWKQIFQKVGVKGLKLNHKGSKSYLEPREKQEIINWLRTKNYWNLGELEYHLLSEYSISYSSKQSYYELFQEAKISWKKSQKKILKGMRL